MMRHLLTFAVVAFAVVPRATSQEEVPRVVAGYALQLESECAAGPNHGPLSTASSPKLIQLAAESPKVGKIFVVDGTLMRCGDMAGTCRMCLDGGNVKQLQIA